MKLEQQLICTILNTRQLDILIIAMKQLSDVDIGVAERCIDARHRRMLVHGEDQQLLAIRIIPPSA